MKIIYIIQTKRKDEPADMWSPMFAVGSLEEAQRTITHSIELKFKNYEHRFVTLPFYPTGEYKGL